MNWIARDIAHTWPIHAIMTEGWLCVLQVPADVQADAESQAKAAQEESDMED